MTKINIFSGFLGAGKTTLIKKLLPDALKGEKVVLIENEFGEIGIDGGFLKDTGINITEINSGCICCSLVGDFEKALKKVIKEYTPDRILIEPSGVGKLSDIVKIVESIKNEGVLLSSKTTVVDAKKCKMYMKNFGEFFNDQVKFANSIILSHTDDLSEEKLHECIHLLKEKNHDAVIISTSWDALKPEQILSAIEGDLSVTEEIKELKHEHCHAHHHDGHCCCGEHHEHHHHHHHAEDIFSSLGFETVRKFTKSDIESLLSSLTDEEKFGLILRAKGYVESSENDNWIYFDYIPGTFNVNEGSPNICGRICVIGSDICEDAIKKLFNI